MKGRIAASGSDLDGSATDREGLMNRRMYQLYNQFKKVSEDSRNFHHQEFEYSDLNNFLSLVKVLLVFFNVGLFVYILYLMKRRFSKETIRSKLLSKSDESTNETPSRVAVVIAHPDDEAMFFTPIILSLIEQNVARIKEIEASCIELGIIKKEQLATESIVAKGLNQSLKSTICVVDSEELQDGMQNKWNKELIGNIVYKFVEDNEITTLLTFDEVGVSSHPNHIDTFKGVQQFKMRIDREKNTNINIFTLDSVGLVRKYIGVLDFIVSLHKNEDNLVTIFTPNPLSTWRAMKSHQTQFVWYRKLFVVFSRYNYVNTLSKLN